MTTGTADPVSRSHLVFTRFQPLAFGTSIPVSTILSTVVAASDTSTVPHTTESLNTVNRAVVADAVRFPTTRNKRSVDMGADGPAANGLDHQTNREGFLMSTVSQ